MKFVLRIRSLRSQSAMEYLMTYGWAILIIAVVLGALFQLGIFSGIGTPKAQPGNCQVVKVGSGISQTISLAGECQGQEPEYVAATPTVSGETLVAPESSSLNTAFDGGSWTIAGWYDLANVIVPTAGWAFSDITEEDTGCTDGLWINTAPATSGHYYAEGEIWWQPSSVHTAPCEAGTNGYGPTNTKFALQFNKWEFLATSFNYVPSGTSTQVVCADNNCQQYTVSIPAGNTPTNYANGYTFKFKIFDGDYPTKQEGGDLANIQLYNTSLSSAELQELYNEGIGGAPIDPQYIVGWWPLNGNCNDYSGNGNNCVISGGVTFSSSWTNGYTAP